MQVQVEFLGEPPDPPALRHVRRCGHFPRQQGDWEPARLGRCRREVPLSGRGPGSVTIPLIFPKGDTARLTGRFVVKTAARPLPIALRGAAPQRTGCPPSRRRGGDAPADPRGGRRGDGGPDQRRLRPWRTGVRIHRLWLYHNEAWLEALDGERLPATPQIESLEGIERRLAFEYRFSRITRPLDRVRFVYVVPSLIVDVPVAFKSTTCRFEMPRLGEARPVVRAAEYGPAEKSAGVLMSIDGPVRLAVVSPPTSLTG